MVPKEERWHIGMPSASGFEDSRFKPQLRLNIYPIRNDAGPLRTFVQITRNLSVTSM